jgi:hypothetical protein
VTSAFLLSGLYLYKTKRFGFAENLLACQEVNKIKISKYFLHSKAEVTLIYDSNNKLQKELVNLTTDVIMNLLKDSPFESSRIKKIDYNSLSAENKQKYKEIENKNEPLILVKQGLVETNFNALSFTHENLHKLREKLRNILFYEQCENIVELRDVFRYLDNPKHKIILLSHVDSNIDKLLSLYRNKSTKVIIIHDEGLKEELRLKDNHFYIYYSPKMPNNMKSAELFIKNELDEQKGI